MCGRSSLDTIKSEIAKIFKCAGVAFKGTSFNITPSQSITVVRKDSDTNKAVLMRWGLIPSWVKSLDSWKSLASPLSSTQGRVAQSIPRNLINARAETIEEKPSFRNGFKKRPCLIPVSGFYGWTKQKQPYYFHTDNPIFVLAGIWETWADADETIFSCTILTTEAQGAIADIHHRMPVVIPAEYYDLWLENVEGRKELLESLPETQLQLYPVSKTVNSPKNDSPDCIQPI